jgi:predicted DNA-binding protein YlxM (UPF0122 family)
MLLPQIVGTSHNTKDSFYDKVERVLEQLPKYHMKILLEESWQSLEKNNLSN